jgi:hypothetical protein
VDNPNQQDQGSQHQQSHSQTNTTAVGTTLNRQIHSSLEEREQRRQAQQQQRLERQIRRENQQQQFEQRLRRGSQNPITVRLPVATTSSSQASSSNVTAETSRPASRQRRLTNETPQSFSQVVSRRQSPEQTPPQVVTPPNNWAQLQNWFQPVQLLNFDNIHIQLEEPHSDHSSESSESEDEMAAVLEYLEDNLHNNTSLRIDSFYGDGTQDPLQWISHFEKVARSNAWDENKKIRKFAVYLEEDAEEWYEDINPEDMDWEAWKGRFKNKYCTTRWKNKWMREVENNRQRKEETIDTYYARFKRLIKRVELPVDHHKRLFIKGLLPHIAPLVSMQSPDNLAAALDLAQAYEEGLDMVNEVEPRKQKKKKVYESSDEEEEEKKPKKSKKKEKAQTTFDPAHNLDDLAKKFEKMQLNLIQKMEKLTTQVNQNTSNRNQPQRNNRGNRNNNSNHETRTCFTCGKQGHIAWDCPDRNNNSNNNSNNPAHAKLVEVEEDSDKGEEDQLLQQFLEAYNAYLGKRERDDSDDEDVAIKRPREQKDTLDSKSELNTFGLPKSKPISKTNKPEITPKKKSKKSEEIKVIKDKKGKKKEYATRPPLFRKKEFDIVEQLQSQPSGLSWADALEVPSIRKSFFEALRKPKEKEIKLADQEYSLKTTALKCNVSVGDYTVPTIVDSGAAISIITCDAMEQLGYEIEEASKSIILPATGVKTQPLGIIRDLPITIQGQTIPIDVEVIDAATYSLLLGNNWLMKANASYNWREQELTLRWRGKTLTVPANCSKETKEEFSEIKANTEEESTDESNIENETSEENWESEKDEDFENEEIIFNVLKKHKSNTPEDKDEEDETVPVFLSEKLNKNDLDIGPLNIKRQQKFDQLMSRNKDLFANDVSSLGRTNITQHQIDVGDAKPIKQRFYRTHPDEDQFIKEELDRMLKKGLIKRSKSPWASPVVLVKKKNGKLRFCVDYRKLNTETRKDAYPIPRIEDMLDALRDAKWFTTLDLASGYWQVEMDPKDQDKTAFITKQGTYEFTVMPFGLTNAPATFQRLMDQVLNDMLYQGVIVYLDDINIYAKTFDEHLEKLEKVFQRLRAAGLKLGPDKCHFLQPKLEFLGHIVSEEGIMADPAKIEKVKNFPRPTTRTKVRSFLGLASYYRKFIKDFSTIAQPLNQLLRKDSELEWTEKCQQSFDALKNRLITEPILSYPDFQQTFYLTTDGSAQGLGAVLSQRNDKGHERVIAYASKSLVGAQKQYGATELECLAVIWAIEHFYSYVGFKHFVLITDHSALKWLYSSVPKGRLARWILRLQPYDFEVQHKPGKENTNADALSRL